MRGVPGSSGPCGTSTGYRRHVTDKTPTCHPGRDAQAAWQRDYRKRSYLNRGPLLIDGTGTRRRLQALARMGWPFATIGAELGVTPTRVGLIARSERVHKGTAQRVAKLYDRWSMQDGGSAHARGRAIRAGWCLPLDWDDEVIDDPKARSHSQHGALVRAGRERAAA